MHSRFGLGCCCGPGDGPPFCFPTLHLTDCDGAPIAGGTVTITTCPVVGGLAPIVGTTDAGGAYAFPNPGARQCFYVSYAGLAAGAFYGIGATRYNCDHDLEFCYRHAGLTVTTTGAADPTVGADPPAFAVVSGAGTGTVVLAYGSLGPCTNFDPFPASTRVTSAPADPSKYLDNCATIDVDCGDDAAVSLPLFRWDADYALYNPGCDYGCDVAGMGPNFRGLIPKVLHVTLTTVAGRTLGVYEGLPITVTWDGVDTWDSGCLGPPGVSCTASPYGPFFGSARMKVLWIPVPFGGGAGSITLIFEEFASSDCTPTPAGGACEDRKIEASASGCRPYFYSPLDVTLPASVLSVSDFSTYEMHIVE